MSSRLTIFKYLPRTIRLTREGTYFALLALAVGFAAVNTGNNLLYLLIAMMLSVIIVSGLLSEQSLKKVSGAVGPLPRLFAGEKGSIPVRLHNHKKRLPSFSLAVVPLWGGPAPLQEAHYIKIAPQSGQTRFLQVIFPKRGRHSMEGFKLLTTFPFGLFLKAAGREARMEIWVYPPIRPISWQAPLSFQAAALSSEQKGQGAGFNQFRDYSIGDDSRLIHWKLTARQRRLIVKEREREEGREITLLFDNVAPSTAKSAAWEKQFERGIETVASLAAAIIQSGWRVGLQTADQEIDPGAGPGHLDLILKALAILEPVAFPRIPTAPEGRSVISVQIAESTRPWSGEEPRWGGEGDVVR